MNDADASIESRDFKMSFYKYAKVKYHNFIEVIFY